MKIKLLQDIWETDKDGNNAGLKVSLHRGQAVPFTKGAVIECSESTAAKFIERKQAEAVGEV